jgi:hypothetical protein
MLGRRCIRKNTKTNKIMVMYTCNTKLPFYWLIDWLVFNVQRAIFQLYSGREHLRIETPRDSKQGKLMGRDGLLSGYTGFFSVRRGWQSLNTGPRFYWRLIRRTGWLWIYTSRTTDGRPFNPKKLSVPFLYPGVPAKLTPFRGLVPLGWRNLIPILLPAHALRGRSFLACIYIFPLVT